MRGYLYYVRIGNGGLAHINTDRMLLSKLHHLVWSLVLLSVVK